MQLCWNQGQCHPQAQRCTALSRGALSGRQGVKGITDIITVPGLVNVDFADVKSIMSGSGTAMLGIGVSTGKNRAENAALVRALNPKS